MHLVTPPHPFDRSPQLGLAIGTIVYRPSQALKVMFHRLYLKLPLVSLRNTRSNYFAMYSNDFPATIECTRQMCGVNIFIDQRHLTLFLASSSWSSSEMSYTRTSHGHKNSAGIFLTCWLLTSFRFMHPQPVPKGVNSSTTALVKALGLATLLSRVTSL